MMKYEVKLILMALAVGVAVVVGARIADWLLPRPPTQLLVCVERADERLKCDAADNWRGLDND